MLRAPRSVTARCPQVIPPASSRNPAPPASLIHRPLTHRRSGRPAVVAMATAPGPEIAAPRYLTLRSQDTTSTMWMTTVGTRSDSGLHACALTSAHLRALLIHRHVMRRQVPRGRPTRRRPTCPAPPRPMFPQLVWPGLLPAPPLRVLLGRIGMLLVPVSLPRPVGSSGVRIPTFTFTFPRVLPSPLGRMRRASPTRTSLPAGRVPVSPSLPSAPWVCGMSDASWLSSLATRHPSPLMTTRV